MANRRRHFDCTRSVLGRVLEDVAAGAADREGPEAPHGGGSDGRQAAAPAGVLDHYAQVVTERGEAAAKAMGRRFLRPAPRDGRAMEGP